MHLHKTPSASARGGSTRFIVSMTGIHSEDELWKAIFFPQIHFIFESDAKHFICSLR